MAKYNLDEIYCSMLAIKKLKETVNKYYEAMDAIKEFKKSNVGFKHQDYLVISTKDEVPHIKSMDLNSLSGASTFSPPLSNQLRRKHADRFLKHIFAKNKNG